MAFSALDLCMKQVSLSPEDLQVRIFQIVFDVFMVHELDFLANGNDAVRILLFHASHAIKNCSWAADLIILN